MSRIGRKPISLPKGVTISVSPRNVVTVKGPKGSLELAVDPDIRVVVEGNQVRLERPTDQKRHKALHGLYRVLIANMVQGVSEGYSRELEIVGIGYRATLKGSMLELALGYSHPVYFIPPEGITLEVGTSADKNPLIRVSGIDKQLVGQVAAKIRALRPPEPYKGKGIRYVGEYIRRKAGKTAGK
jgi:large subunit ribosomal protein L6|nr:MAG: 50S ribosomal protein L6 [Bacteroidota bacterium]